MNHENEATGITVQPSEAPSVVNMESGVITLGGRAYSMDRRRTHGPNSWLLITKPGKTTAVLLRNGEGKPFAYAARESGAWFGTAAPHADGQEGAFFLFGLSTLTERDLGIAHLKYGDECALAGQVVTGGMKVWAGFSGRTGRRIAATEELAHAC